MATLKQIEANRRNALKSTGPRTPEGKAVVSLNSLRHGLRARTVVLPGEKRHEFHRLCNDLEAEWQPQSRTEQFYLEQMAVSQWKLTRMEVGEADIFRQAGGAATQVPLLDRLWQCQCRLERSYARAQRELERLQNSRPHQVHQPEEATAAPEQVAPALEEMAPPPQPPAGFLSLPASLRRSRKSLRTLRTPPASALPPPRRWSSRFPPPNGPTLPRPQRRPIAPYRTSSPGSLMKRLPRASEH